MMEPSFLTVGGIRLEYRSLRPPSAHAPTLIFLHEGLGCVSLWRDFPDRLVDATGCGALVYSRAGYGRSDACPLPRAVDFMDDEAEVLARIVEQTGIREPILIGHSDGASIALIYAGRQGLVRPRALVLEAPHVFTEPFGLASIARVAEQYRTTDLRERLTRHHGQNVDRAFWGWNEVWLHPDFRTWNIKAALPAITAPVLVVQGDADEYGTWRQVEAIQSQAGGTVEAVRLSGCGHSPHRERPDQVLALMKEFITRV